MKTGLHDFHVQNGAKMVPFSGWSMPLSYGDVGQSTAFYYQFLLYFHIQNTLSHLNPLVFRGPNATAFLERLTPSSLTSLAPFFSTLSVLLLPHGGILDDTIITKHAPDAYYVVTNAGRRTEDLAWFGKQYSEWKEGDLEWEVMDGWGLVALQVHVARGGYTGEDGFEISIPQEHTVSLTSKLTESPSVQLAGLGARDSLRLEAGMCLYGNDLDESTTPVEAALSWVIGKERREKGGFVGAETVLKQLKEGPPRRRIGLLVEGAPARHGAKIFSKDSEPLGTVTSGIPSPTLGKNIAMGYVRSGAHKKGTELLVEVRGKMRPAVVTPMPFVPAKYWRG
ncbi:glycine cleavage system T protein [Amylostereum chailletii]|nr:glycine cleavage system T protein [Amylostereum chailletii]